MREKVKVLLLILFIWFTLDITGFSFINTVLVESPGLYSIDFAWWIIFGFCILCYLFLKRTGKQILATFLAIWAYIQYSSHWHYTLFGASEKKITSYNIYFKNTLKLIPSSSGVIIPDLYHIVLHLLIISTLILITYSIISGIRIKHKKKY